MGDHLPCLGCLELGNIDLNLNDLTLVCQICDWEAKIPDITKQLAKYRELLPWITTGERPCPDCPRCDNSQLHRTVDHDQVKVTCEACELEMDITDVTWALKVWPTMLAWLAAAPNC